MKNYVNVFLYFNLICCFFCSSVFAQEKTTKKEITPLEFGQKVEREIGGVYAQHLYKINLSAGQFVKIEAEQNGCDVIFALMSEDKFNNFDVDNKSTEGVEWATAGVEKAGVYELRVMSVSEKTGSYKLKIAELRLATEKEINLTAGTILGNDAFNKSSSSSTTESILQSITKLELALEKFRLAEEKINESRALNNIGALYQKLGYSKKSIEYFEKALQAAYTIDSKYEIALNLSNLGTAHQAEGNWQKAFDELLKSLQLRRELNNNKRSEAMSLNKIGDFFRQLGDNDRALNYFQQALVIIQQSELSKNFEADTYENFGATYFSLNELEKARESYQKALAISQKTKSRRREATFLNCLGKIAFKLGETAKALNDLDESLKISRELKDKLIEAATLKNLGQIYLALGEIEKSVEVINQSLETYRFVEDKRNLAETLLISAKVESKRGNLESAQGKTEEAISLIETIRARVQTADLRDWFSANLQDFYNFYIELLMQRHKLEPNKNFAALALQANERARARGLLNLLAESNANIREGVDEKLLQKETELKNLLSARLENLTRVLNGKPKTEEIGKLKIEIEQIRAEYEQTQTRIRQVSPRYAALTQPKTLDLREIQTQILDADSVLLEYALGETKSYLWIVTKENLQTVELPAKSEIERIARAFYESLTARNKQIRFETPIEREDRIFQTDSDMRKFSAELSRMILAPAASFTANKRLLIVGDGALQYVPFAALTNPKSNQRNSNSSYLIETNEIVNLPSASVLAILRKETQNRKLPAKTLAIFADPIFDEQDTRFQAVGKNKFNQKPADKIEYVAVSKKKTRSFDNLLTRNGLDLPRLPFTRREADSISSLVPQKQQEKLLDFAANRSAAMSATLSDYRFIHFATHGFINNENPELSGIVLSLLDEKGKEQDGFLRVGDVYNLKLPAEMVVLSGCKTGLGKEIRGEGLIGLTRGFMYAGAKRVTVSLWDVNDEATAELMGRFYREIIGDKKLAPASALRQTQISMIKDKRWQNPYFWATFALQGEPR